MLESKGCEPPRASTVVHYSMENPRHMTVLDVPDSGDTVLT